MPNLILNQKVKYKGKSYPVNEKGVTEPIPVTAKDVEFFEDVGMIVDVRDDKGNKIYLDDRDKTIEDLEAEIEKLQNQLAAKDEIITDLEVQVEELKGDGSGDGDNATDDSAEKDGTDDDNTDNEQPEGEPLEEKTVEELYTIAGELDISGRSKLRNDKEALLEAVKKALAEKAGD